MTRRLLAALLLLLLTATACSGAGDEVAEVPDDRLDLPGDARPDRDEQEDDDRDEVDAAAAEDEAPAQAPGVAEDAGAGAVAEPAPAPLPTTPGTSPLDSYLPPPITSEVPVPPPTNPFTDTAADALSTFGLDVDTGAYSLARAQILDGRAPDPSAVRVEEFVNAFDYGYEVDAGEVFTVTTDVAPWPWASGGSHALLRVGLATPEAEGRTPATVIAVVDTSGSMTDLLPLVQESLRQLTGSLSPRDQVALVTYSDTAAPVLGVTDAADRAAILDGIDRLTIGGSTNLEAGLDLGYDLAREIAGGERTTRVVLISDGIANVGSTTPGAILDTVEQGTADGVELVTVGVGLEGFNDPLMEQLADRGDGFYAYVDTAAEAEALFAGELLATRPAVARDARAQIAFDPAQVVRYRLIGYENRDIADDDFRDDAVDAGELVAGHTATALYELELTGDATGAPLATVQLRWLDPGDGTARERAHPVTGDDVSRTWQDTPASFRLAGSVAAWAEWLRGSEWATTEPAGIAAEVEALARPLADPDVDELLDLVTATT